MNKNEIIEGLDTYKNRLLEEVIRAYEERGCSYGGERFGTWKKKLTQFLDVKLPRESTRLNPNSFVQIIPMKGPFESEVEYFWRTKGNKALSYLDSLILDIQNDEYDPVENFEAVQVENSPLDLDHESVFIVHGHDNETKERTARFIEKLGFNAIILHEQASRGQTIIEKIGNHTNVGFAIVLYTPDDKGNTKDKADEGELNQRARQNVVFEHGYLIGKLGRERVTTLVSGKIELPNDISGIVYISDSDWQVDIAKEMKAAGYEVDFNKIL
jgi:predicted nucleotide-binding protein